MADLKRKGDLAELMVAADLARQGYRIAFPYGEDWDFDLLAERDGVYQRVQVKYTTSDGVTVILKCRSHSITNGRIRNTKYYTANTVDWMAVYDATSRRCLYVPARELGTGKSYLHIRLVPCSYRRTKDVRMADDYESMEPAGLEPATSSVQGKRSPS